MGSRFFQKAPTVSGGGGSNMTARAISSGGYAGRVAAGAASKDIGAAIGLYKAHAGKPIQRGAAYPKGPKI